MKIEPTSFTITLDDDMNIIGFDQGPEVDSGPRNQDLTRSS